MKLVFYENGLDDDLRIVWPAGEPKLQAYLGTDRNLAFVNTNFMMELGFTTRSGLFSAQL